MIGNNLEKNNLGDNMEIRFLFGYICQKMKALWVKCCGLNRNYINTGTN